jgi:hypothetical protein
MQSSPLLTFIFRCGTILTIILNLSTLVAGEDAEKKTKAAQHGYEHNQLKEFEEFCDNQQQLREDPDSIKSISIK